MENGRSSVYALRILSNLHTALKFSHTKSMITEITDMRLSTANCRVPATERTYLWTCVME